jgi:hypothetical protein
LGLADKDRTAEYLSQRYLIGAFGNVNWVRNLHAAGEATLTRARFTRGYFEVSPDSSLEEFEREALSHPVFAVQPVMAPRVARETMKSGSL